MDPFEDLILYDISPDSTTDLEKEILYNEMIEGGEEECLDDYEMFRNVWVILTV